MRLAIFISLVGLLSGCEIYQAKPGSHAVYTRFDLSAARRLRPEEAKAIVLAQARGVEISNPRGAEGEPRSHAPTETVFEVFRVKGGWYVWAHEGRGGPREGRSVFIDGYWNAYEAVAGAPITFFD